MSRRATSLPYSVFAEFYDAVAAPLRGPVRRAHEEILLPLVEGLRQRREREAAGQAGATPPTRGRNALRAQGQEAMQARARNFRAPFRPETRISKSETRFTRPDSRIIACDLCCGTGTTALEMARRGYEVYAVDRSREMLAVAREKFERARAGVKIVRADMRLFRLPEPVDLITCEFDAINHVAHKRDLGAVARAVARALRPGGWFFFDANTTRAFRELWVANWIVEGDGYFLAARGGFDPRRGKGWTDFDWFVPVSGRRRGGRPGAEKRRLWRRHTEHFEEVAWTDGEIRSALVRAGLRVGGVWDLMRFARKEPWAQPGNRKFWLAQKGPGQSPGPS